ncbi:MAG: glycosyltransferase [Patescibacteria group bacterium]
MKLDIILRTHSTGNLRPGTRFLQVPKEQLVLTCTTSLINSANLVSPDDHEIKIVIVDDHSTESCVAGLKRILATSKHPTQLIQIEQPGHAASLMACYEYGRDHARDVIYFIEDDYLHFPSAISEMIEMYDWVKASLGDKEVALLANDDPDSYRNPWMEPARIVLGKYRHWRTNLFSTSSFWFSKKTLLKYWDIYMRHTHYGEHEVIHEGTTVDRVWRHSVQLFTPIPSLAVHMEYTDNIAPFVYWEGLWKSIIVP